MFSLAGSPYQFTVGYLNEMGAHKVRAAGVGLKRAETNKKQSFNLYTREAGRGELEVTMEGPSKADLQFHEHEVKIFSFKFGIVMLQILFFEKRLYD